MIQRTWGTPGFDSLPASADTRFRWVGYVLVDDEQYRTEGWERSEDGYWRISIEGCVAYANLRAGRRAERKSSWQARQDADDQWSDYIAGLVETKP